MYPDEMRVIRLKNKLNFLCEKIENAERGSREYHTALHDYLDSTGMMMEALAILGERSPRHVVKHKREIDVPEIPVYIRKCYGAKQSALGKFLRGEI